MPQKKSRPLAGWRVLVPRGGEWGNSIAASLRGHGAEPVISPMVNFASTDRVDELADALTRLRSGDFDWVLITTAATVDVLVSQDVDLPPRTRLAAVGENSVSALRLGGYPVDFTLAGDQSAENLIEKWSVERGSRVLILSPEAPWIELEGVTRSLGLHAETVVAYRTVGISVPDEVRSGVAEGTIGAVLVTSGSVAKQVRDQLSPLPADTLVAAIGPRTAFDARALGIEIDVIAEELTEEALIGALVAHLAQRR
ncbi:MAG: uroporphyrinogen-III synthase [Cryobacterium sp.]|nr:uroporphyrinogen-III synthase [Cryobacterium sp.]